MEKGENMSEISVILLSILNDNFINKMYFIFSF